MLKYKMKFNFYEMKKILRIPNGLRNSKAPRFYEINKKLLKKLPENAFIALNQIFNACLKCSYFPSVWKNSKVIANS